MNELINGLKRVGIDKEFSVLGVLTGDIVVVVLILLSRYHHLGMIERVDLAVRPARSRRGQGRLRSCGTSPHCQFLELYLALAEVQLRGLAVVLQLRGPFKAVKKI